MDVQFTYYLADDCNQQRLQHWRDQYIKIRKEWIAATKHFGAAKYHNRAFHRPDRFSFKRTPGKDWYPVRKLNGYWIYKPAYDTTAYHKVQNLPDLMDFDTLCTNLGFPLRIRFGGRSLDLKTNSHKLVWYPLWADIPKSDVVIRGPILMNYTILPNSDVRVPNGFSTVSPEQALWLTNIPRKRA